MSELKLPNRQPDLPLLLFTIVLIVIGIIMIISTSSVVGYTGYNDSYYFIKKHCLYLMLGVGLFIVGLKTPHYLYYKWVGWGLFISCILVGLTMVPGVGVMAFGARRWINLGFISFQPVELLKFFVIAFTAWVLTIKKDKIRSFKKGLVPLFAMVLVPILLTAKQPDLGNTMLMAVLERTRELGMLTAVGMKRKEVFGMIVLETLFLGMVAAPIGLFLGALTVSYFGAYGLDLSAYSGGMEKFGLQSIVYPTLESSVFLKVAIAVAITAIIGALYPAFKATRLKPGEAIRKI